MNNIFKPTLDWIRDDYNTHPFRFFIELLAWAAYTRKSFGMLANYILLTSIDTIGLIRMLWN